MGKEKMAAPTEFTLESVRSFMLEKGGKVTNHDLVKHFKQFLTDPYTKGNVTRSPKRLNAFNLLRIVFIQVWGGGDRLADGRFLPFGRDVRTTFPFFSQLLNHATLIAENPHCFPLPINLHFFLLFTVAKNEQSSSPVSSGFAQSQAFSHPRPVLYRWVVVVFSILGVWRRGGGVWIMCPARIELARWRRATK